MGIVSRVGSAIGNVGTRIGDFLRGSPNVGRIGYTDTAKPPATTSTPQGQSALVPGSKPGTAVIAPASQYKPSYSVGGGGGSPSPSQSITQPTLGQTYNVPTDTTKPFAPPSITQPTTISQSQQVKSQNITLQSQVSSQQITPPKLQSSIEPYKKVETQFVPSVMTRILQGAGIKVPTRYVKTSSVGNEPVGRIDSTSYNKQLPGESSGIRLGLNTLTKLKGEYPKTQGEYAKVLYEQELERANSAISNVKSETRTQLQSQVDAGLITPEQATAQSSLIMQNKLQANPDYKKAETNINKLNQEFQVKYAPFSNVIESTKYTELKTDRTIRRLREGVIANIPPLAFAEAQRIQQNAPIIVPVQNLATANLKGIDYGIFTTNIKGTGYNKYVSSGLINTALLAGGELITIPSQVNLLRAERQAKSAVKTLTMEDLKKGSFGVIIQDFGKVNAYKEITIPIKNAETTYLKALLERKFINEPKSVEVGSFGKISESTFNQAKDLGITINRKAGITVADYVNPVTLYRQKGLVIQNAINVKDTSKSVDIILGRTKSGGISQSVSPKYNINLAKVNEKGLFEGTSTLFKVTPPSKIVTKEVGGFAVETNLLTPVKTFKFQSQSSKEILGETLQNILTRTQSKSAIIQSGKNVKQVSAFDVLSGKPTISKTIKPKEITIADITEIDIMQTQGLTLSKGQQSINLKKGSFISSGKSTTSKLKEPIIFDRVQSTKGYREIPKTPDFIGNSRELTKFNVPEAQQSIIFKEPSYITGGGGEGILSQSQYANLELSPFGSLRKGYAYEELGFDLGKGPSIKTIEIKPGFKSTPLLNVKQFKNQELMLDNRQIEKLMFQSPIILNKYQSPVTIQKAVTGQAQQFKQVDIEKLFQPEVLQVINTPRTTPKYKTQINPADFKFDFGYPGFPGFPGSQGGQGSDNKKKPKLRTKKFNSSYTASLAAALFQSKPIKVTRKEYERLGKVSYSGLETRPLLQIIPDKNEVSKMIKKVKF